VAVEFVLLAPVLLILMLFVVYLGRATQANARVHHAADQAARAASLVSGSHAGSAAQSTAVRELTAGGVRCDALSVSSSRTTSAGLESVTVTVSCTVPRDQLAPLAPGSRLVSATSTEVIDVIRAKD
jgi:Flp pilus assembly protein TadG